MKIKMTLIKTLKSDMYQAMKEQQIKEAMLKQINTGSKTISLTQAKDIYTYLSRLIILDYNYFRL